MERHDDRRRQKLLFLMFAGAVSIILLVIGAYQLIQFTDSTAFCGQLCHNVMYPEYTTYQASPHSRVLCSDCHVGPGAGYLVKSKISGVPQIFAVAFSIYERPITTPVKNLRPARETCEQCHRPELFAGDVVRTHTTYLTDEKNTKQVDTRILKVGGGETGVAQDIHWHIAASVWYLPLDEKREEIGWVGTEGEKGYIAEWVDPQFASKVDTKRIEEEKRLMDCMDCHNRATHIFSSPEELIDTAMVVGKIDSSLPYLKREAARALYPANSTLEEAYQKVESLRDFYQTSYPQVYVQKKEAIENAIAELREVARLTTFPDMNVTWDTYEDNAGHQKSPGCFRCHGKLVASTGAEKGTTVNASCELCHHPITP